MGDEAAAECSYHGQKRGAFGGVMMKIMQYFLTLEPLPHSGVTGFLFDIAGFSSVRFAWPDGSVTVLAAAQVALRLHGGVKLPSAFFPGSWNVIGCTGLACSVRRGGPKATHPFFVQKFRETL